jgi:cold shock protein
MEPQIVTGRVSWFKLDKKFGFLALDDGSGDVFLHVSVLKAAGYVSVPAGTTMRVRIEKEQGRRRVVEVLSVDTTTARTGEPSPALRKGSYNSN